eukprot:scaffold2527_cov337-Prasinococcus_capsulatus_cf.AAC.9
MLCLLRRDRHGCPFCHGLGVHGQTGFFTGRKKESIFKSPESLDGRVGVTGSGKGVTHFKDRKRHEYEG